MYLVQGLGLRVQESEFKIEDLGVLVEDAGKMPEVLEPLGSGFMFRVQGLVLRS